MHILYLLKIIIRPLTLAILLSTSLLAFAGPPYETDDPDPTEYQHYEIYVASEYHRSSEDKSGTLPHLEVNYGLIPDVQIAITVPLAFSETEGHARHYGLGDIDFGVKYRFIQETETMPMVSFYPSIKSHTGNDHENFGSGSNEYFLPIWLSKSWDDWTAYGGGGYTITHESGAKNHWFFGGVLEKQITEHLTMGGEIFHETEESSGDHASSGFNIGGSYDFNERHHIVFSAGKGVKNSHLNNQRSSFIAYLLTF